MEGDDFLNRPLGGINADDNAIRREEIDVSNLLYPSQQSVESPQAKLESYLYSNPPVDAGPAERNHRPGRRKFAKLALAGTKDFFLLDDKKDLYDGVAIGYIKGQIEACASANNGQRYRVSWHPSDDVVKPVGPLDVSHLKHYYKKSKEMMDHLQMLNEVYKDKFGNEPVVHKKRKASASEAAPAAAAFSTPVRRQMAANLRTKETSRH